MMNLPLPKDSLNTFCILYFHLKCTAVLMLSQASIYEIYVTALLLINLASLFIASLYNSSIHPTTNFSIFLNKHNFDIEIF